MVTDVEQKYLQIVINNEHHFAQNLQVGNVYTVFTMY